jgi:acetyl esterase/lipase
MTNVRDAGGQTGTRVRGGRTLGVSAAAAALFILPLSATAQVAAPPAASALPSITPIAKPTYPGEMPLYPGRATRAPEEQWENYLGGPIVRNVVRPTLIPVFPDSAKRNGTAVIYAPGGGFQYLGMNDAEPRLLAEQGVTVFILKYRTDPTVREPRTFLTNLYKFLFDMVARNKQPGASEMKAFHAHKEALEDGLAAVRLVRRRASEWGVDPKRIGFMGPSAGAMTAIDVSFTTDAEARPDFVVAMIGPKKVEAVPATAPPLFVAASSDDPLFPASTENIVSAWNTANRPVEAHFFEKGGHSLAKGTTGEPWFGSLVNWMKMHGWLGSAR